MTKKGVTKIILELVIKKYSVYKKYAGFIKTNRGVFYQSSLVDVVLLEDKIVFIRRMFVGKRAELEIAKEYIESVDYREIAFGSAEIIINHTLYTLHSPYVFRIRKGFDEDACDVLDSF